MSKHPYYIANTSILMTESESVCYDDGAKNNDESTTCIYNVISSHPFT